MQQAFIFFIPGVQVFIRATGQTDTFRGSSALGRHVRSLNQKERESEKIHQAKAYKNKTERQNTTKMHQSTELFT